jgi:hypothetical protein
MKQRVYIDTSVIGGCFDKEFEDWSNQLFEDFISGKRIAVISESLWMNCPKRQKKFRIISVQFLNVLWK